MTSQFILLRGQERVGNDLNLDLNRELNLPLKSLSPDQPPGWNDPYCILKFRSTPEKARLATQTFNPAALLSVTPVPCSQLFVKGGQSISWITPSETDRCLSVFPSFSTRAST